MRLFPDEFTGTLPQETLDGGFREANPLADTYRFGGGKRGRQEGKQFGVPLVQHSDFHFWRYAAFHGTEVFRQPDGTVGAFFVNLVHVGFSTDTAHDLNDQTEADEVGFQFAAEGFLRLAFRLHIDTAVHLILPPDQTLREFGIRKYL